MKTHKLIKSKGFTVIEILLVLGIVGFLGYATTNIFTSSQKKTTKTIVESDRQLLKTACVTYLLENDDNAILSEIKDNKNLEITKDIDAETNHFVETLYNKIYTDDYNVGTNLTEFNQRFKWIDTDKLLQTGLIEQSPQDNRYVLDVESGTVLHVSDNQDVLDLFALTMTGSGTNTSINTMTVKKFYLKTTSNTEMNKLNTSLNIGNVLYLGGTSTLPNKCYLVKAVLTNTGVVITDLSNQLNSPLEVKRISQQMNGLNIEYLDTSSTVQYKLLTNY